MRPAVAKVLAGAACVAALIVMLRTRSTANPASQPDTLGTATARPASSTPIQNVAARLPTAPTSRRQQTAPTSTAVRHAPASLAQLPDSQEMRKAIDILKKNDPFHSQVAIADYNLGVMSALNDCIAGRIQAGTMEILMWFSRGEEEGSDAVGTTVEEKVTNLKEAERRLVLSCVEQFHRDRVLKLPAESTMPTQMMSYLTIRFPVEDSGLYHFLSSGDINDLVPPHLAATVHQ